MKSINEYDYPKQFIINESEGTKIFDVIGEEEGAEEIDDYQFNVISTITEKTENGEKYFLIQHEDQRVGWINLKDSIQIFRFQSKNVRFTGDDFIANEINDALDIVKDFKTHFTGKILTVKSEIEFKGTRLLGVFIKGKFFGFHNEEYFEELIECDVDLPENEVYQKDLYKVSKMEEIHNEGVDISNPKLVSIFKESGIGRVQANKKEFYWITLDGLENYIANIILEAKKKSQTEKEIDDLFYAIYRERQQSKELVKTVLSAKDYLKTKKTREKDHRIKTLESSFKNARNKKNSLDNTVNELKDEVQILKNEIQKLKAENKELSNDVKLNIKRIEQQKDYNKRLELQKDKYKERMEFVNEKLKTHTNKKI